MGPGLLETLRAAGLSPGPPLVPALRGQCAALARRMRELQLGTLGLLPACDAAAVPAVAIELGRAVAQSSVGIVGVLDGDGSWPCAAALIELTAAGEERLAATHWLGENLALLTPRADGARTALDRLGLVLAQEGPAFHHLIVDLTGFDHRGDHLAAAALLDGVVLVARSGRTTRQDVRRLERDLEGGPALGVLLTGL